MVVRRILNPQSNATAGAVLARNRPYFKQKLSKITKIHRCNHAEDLRGQMASSAAACGADLNLSATQLYPEGVYFEAGNKGTLSFSWVNESRLRFAAEDKIRPFFETLNYWGIQRKRTRISCDACGRLLGYVYDDGPPAMQGTGQFGMGPSQVIPRQPRYRIKTKAVTMANPPAAAPRTDGS
ncbi:hypothetical protein GUJ93_ZPchr0013g37694 [Zizania palustris]|uniref:Uncharacterized protein n=1 Tax=Zizania palustris TaxID=103762 RepID=A0A8J6BWV6_ZIZPA|nr:hypothetical protein GUJ93_ZPchr0013g37694 [Zizania palustris]